MSTVGGPSIDLSHRIKESESPSSQTLTWLKEQLLPSLLAALLSAGAFLGIVTVAGGAMAWARYSAVGLPAIDIVSVLPRSHLLVMGALSLVSVAVAAFLVLGVAYALAASLAPRSRAEQQSTQPEARHDEPKAPPTEDREWRLLLLMIGLLVVAAVLVAVLFELRGRSLVIYSAVGFLVAATGVGLAIQARGSRSGTERGDQPFHLRNGRRLVLSAVVATGIAITAWLIHNGWVGLTLLVALVLVTALFSFVRNSQRSPIVVAIAIASAVLLFGLVASVAKTLDDPKMPWVTVAYTTAAGTRSVDWGLYIVETGDRLWMASTVADPDNKVVKSETRLYWIGRDKITDVRMGSTTHVNGALNRAWQTCTELSGADTLCGPTPEQRYRALRSSAK